MTPPELHPLSFAHPSYDGSVSGELMAPTGSAEPLPLGVRRVIAHRAMMEIDADTHLVNLGIGMPEVYHLVCTCDACMMDARGTVCKGLHIGTGTLQNSFNSSSSYIAHHQGVAAMVASAQQSNPLLRNAQLTVESGTFGGQPLSGDRFGTTRNATSFLLTASMLDLYQGGGLDLTVLGMAQVDGAGNVNVSRFGPRAPGCGGVRIGERDCTQFQ